MRFCTILFKGNFLNINFYNWFIFEERHYRLVVVGGGTGGLAVASHFSRLLPKGNVAIIEPSKVWIFFFKLGKRNGNSR